MRSGTKSAQLKARCEKELKARLIVIAADQRVDLSDVIRIACYDYAHRITSCQTISTRSSESASPKI